MAILARVKKASTGLDAINGKFYVSSISIGVKKLDELADHIASHGSIYTRDVIYGVLMKFVDCAKELMGDGYRVQLGDIGTLRFATRSKAKADASKADFSSVERIKVLFTPSAKMKLDAKQVKLAWLRDVAGSEGGSPLITDYNSTDSNSGSGTGSGSGSSSDNGNYNEHDGID